MFQVAATVVRLPRLEISVQGQIETLAAAPRQLPGSGQLFEGKIAGQGAQAELFTAGVHPVGAVSQGRFQFFEVTGRGQQFGRRHEGLLGTRFDATDEHRGRQEQNGSGGPNPNRPAAPGSKLSSGSQQLITSGCRQGKGHSAPGRSCPLTRKIKANRFFSKFLVAMECPPGQARSQATARNGLVFDDQWRK